jgi:hypothetical protein
MTRHKASEHMGKRVGVMLCMMVGVAGLTPARYMFFGFWSSVTGVTVSFLVFNDLLKGTLEP